MTKTSMLALVGLVLVGSVLAGVVACNRKPPGGPDAALERAYKAGILSKDEYEAKKASLLAAPPAVSAAVPSVAAPPVAVAPAPPATPPTIEPTPLVAPPKKAPVAAARVTRPKAVPVPASAPESPDPEPPPAPRIAAPAPAAEPAAVDRGDEAPAPASACAEAEIRPGKEKGKQERFYPMPLAQVREAALKSLKDLEFNVRRASGTELEASKKRHLGLLIGSGGEKMTLQFEEAVQGGQRGTRVTGETKKGFVMRAGQKSWTNAVLDQTACTLHGSARAAGRSDERPAIR